MNAKILEIFQSIQGEGKYAGVKQVFVRFFECNIHCSWCDTPASIGDTSRNYKEMTLDEVFGAIDKLWTNHHSVSLTGGEPLLQKDFLKALLPSMKKAHMPAFLETGGILFNQLSDVIGGIDIVSMDVKLPSSTGLQPFWNEHAEFLKIAAQKDCYVKAVISAKTSHEDIEKTVELVAGVDPHLLLILQPNTFELKEGAVAKAVEYLDYCLKYIPNTRVLPQMHKFMKVA